MAENPRIEELRRRVQADPASIAFAALAEEFRRVGRYEDAIETCRAGLHRHPAYLSARVTLGRALIEVGEYDGARDELETVLRSAPENIAAIRGLEQINERLGHSTEMHPDLAAMAAQAPKPPPPAPRPAPEPALALDPISLASLDLSLAPADPTAEPDAAVDIFAAAAATDEPLVVDLDPQTLDSTPLTFEEATIAFAAPVLPAAQPDPHVAATLMRLETFLGAIQTARHV